MRMMASEDGITGPVNLGNPHEITVRHLAERIVAMTGARSRIVHRPLPQDDPMQGCPDIALARRELGWEPSVALDAGLARTIAYFEALLSARGSGTLATADVSPATERAAQHAP